MSDKAHASSETFTDLNGTNVQHEVSSLFDVAIALVQRRRPIIGVTIGVALLTAVIVFIVPSKYTAETLVLPPTQNSSLSASLLGQMGGASPLASLAGAGLGLKSSGDMYVSLFRSHTVEDSVIKRFGLMERYHKKNMVDTRFKFEHYSTVVLGVKDGLIRITVTDRDPKLAAEMANDYVDAFRNLSKNLAITEASQRRLFFEQQLREANNNLTNAEEEMKKTQQSTGMLQVDSQARTLIQSAAVLRGQISAKEVELHAMLSYATEDNPQVIVAQQELAGLKSQLAKLTRTDTNADSEILLPKGNIPQAGIEYLRKLRDLKYYETIEELIAKQFEMAKLDEARQGAIVQVADIAVPPDKRSFPHRTVTVLLAMLIAMFFSVLWALADARWKLKLQDPSERAKAQVLSDLLRSRNK